MSGIKDILKAGLRRIANRAGYDIVGFDSHNARWRLAQLLKRQGITLVLDVGANEGHFGWDLRELGFTGKIISFEPLHDAFARLNAAAGKDPNWQALNIGLGDKDEQRTIHVAANSQSSSFLPMLAGHQEAAPESAYKGDQLATLRRLDGIFAELAIPADRAFLKIDTQGFEKPVLEGARGILKAVPLVQLECSLVPLYEGGGLIETMIADMRALGYDPVEILPTFHHRDGGQLMQADILFASR